MLIETLVVSLGLESVTELEKENPKLTFEYQNTTDIFTDIIEISVVDDTVCLGLGIKSKAKGKAIVKTRVYMTISHFARLITAGNDLITNIQEEIKRLQQSKNKTP